MRMIYKQMIYKQIKTDKNRSKNKKEYLAKALIGSIKAYDMILLPWIIEWSSVRNL